MRQQGPRCASISGAPQRLPLPKAESDGYGKGRELVEEAGYAWVERQGSKRVDYGTPHRRRPPGEISAAFVVVQSMTGNAFDFLLGAL